MAECRGPVRAYLQSDAYAEHFPTAQHALDAVYRRYDPDSCSLSADQRSIRLRKGARVWAFTLVPDLRPGETRPDAERRYGRD